MIYTIVFFSTAAVIAIVGLVCCCCNPGGAAETAGGFALISSIVGIAARLGWLITLSIMYKRIRGSWEIATANQKIAKAQSLEFGRFATTCGDPYAVLNY